MTELYWQISYYKDYAKIALENYTIIQQLLEKRKAIDEKLNSKKQIPKKEDDEYVDINTNINKHSRVVIIFCSLSLEAFINDYAINHLSKSYMEKYLDKLDLCSKWVIFPRIIAGSQLDTGAQPMQNLAWLIKERNALVHHKSVTVEASKIGDRINRYNEQAAQKAITTVNMIVLALHKIDQQINETWLKYKGEWFPSERLNSTHLKK